jgi:hypothetical protein
MKRVSIILLSLITAACALPETTVSSGAQRPRLVIQGAPDDAELVVDGITMGAAQRFNGQPGVLLVEEGVHQVEVRRAGMRIHAEKLLIGAGETRALQVNSGGR